MSRPCRVFVCLLALVSAAPLRAQSFNLRDLLTDFLRDGIVLSDPPPGSPFPSHSHHFVAETSPEFLALQQFNNQIANQLSSFPLASSSGGFSYTYDPKLGVFTRTSDSFGPIYAERADTIGKGRFNLGLNFSHFTFNDINNLSLRDGDLRLVFTHEDINHDGTNFQPFFEGDVITAQLFLKIQSDITAFVLTYGVTDRFDIGAAIPLVSISIDAQTDATIQRLATAANPAIHTFVGGGSEATIKQSGSASGVGDVVLRGKYRFTSSPKFGFALGTDVRLPTGDYRDLLGTGALEVRAYMIGSAHLGAFSPHLNAGYTWALHPAASVSVADEINYTGGFDWALSPRFTVVVDAIGRTFRNTQSVQVVDATFFANTNPSSAQPPTVVSAEFPRLVTTTANLNTLLGSVGFRVNPVGNLLLTVNGLFSISKKGLRDDFTPLVAIDYAF